MLLPDVDSSCDAVKAYLKGRGIHPEIIDYCIEKKLLFQTSQYKNALFVGYDRMGKPHYGALRSTFSRFKSEATGSDKHYSFSIAENPQADTVHLFEAAIDLLSYATLEKYAGRDWKQEALLSLAGVFASKRQGVVPVRSTRRSPLCGCIWTTTRWAVLLRRASWTASRATLSWMSRLHGGRMSTNSSSCSWA